MQNKSQGIWSRQFQTAFSFHTHDGSCDCDILLMTIIDNCQFHLEDSSAQSPSVLQLHQSASVGGEVSLLNMSQTQQQGYLSPYQAASTLLLLCPCKS